MYEEPLPIPPLTVSAYTPTYVAVRLTACVGIVTVVLEALGSSRYTVSPVHLSKTILVAGASATITTRAVLVYGPLPIPPLTVRGYVGIEYTRMLSYHSSEFTPLPANSIDATDFPSRLLAEELYAPPVTTCTLLKYASNEVSHNTI